MITAEFVKRFDDLQPGESFIYHRGYLAIDIHNIQMLTSISHLASELQEKGTAELMQKKIGRGFWEYIIIKRRKVRKL